MSYASAGQDHIGSYIFKVVCIHNQENMKNLERVMKDAHYCVVLLLQQCGLVLIKICNLEFQQFKTLILMLKLRVTGN
jgi:hypothetical protein